MAKWMTGILAIALVLTIPGGIRAQQPAGGAPPMALTALDYF